VKKGRKGKRENALRAAMYALWQAMYGRRAAKGWGALRRWRMICLRCIIFGIHIGKNGGV
jgi:hypothetical protein